MTNQSFLGTGWSFPPRFTKTGVRMVSDEEDIAESLRILLSTNPGERVMRPDFGCGIRPHVFSPMDESAKSILSSTIRRAILFHEPRVTVEKIHIERSESDLGAILIGIDYTIDATNNRRNIVFPYYLAEGTDVVR